MRMRPVALSEGVQTQTEGGGVIEHGSACSVAVGVGTRNEFKGERVNASE